MVEGPFVDEKTLTPPSLKPQVSNASKRIDLAKDDGFFKRLVADLLTSLQVKGGIGAIDKLIVAGHSGAYGIISAVLDYGGLNDRIDGVVFLDATVANLSSYISKSDRSGKRADLYIVHQPDQKGWNPATGAQQIKQYATFTEQTSMRHRDIPDAFFGKYLAAIFSGKVPSAPAKSAPGKSQGAPGKQKAPAQSGKRRP